MAGEVAKAYVTLIPSARGFRRRLSNELNGPIRDESRRQGNQFGNTFMGRFAQRVKSNFKFSIASVLAGLGPALIPVLATATAAVGAFGSALAAAGLGVGGFAAIAIPAFTKVHAATQQVLAAQRAYNLATTSAARQSALRRERAALAALTPGERELAKVLGVLTRAWGQAEKALQPTVVKALIPWVGALKDGMRFLAPVVRPAASAIHDLGTVMSNVFESPFMMRFFRQMGQFGENAITSFGLSVINLGQGLAHLLLAFRPLSQMLLNALPGLTARFSQWAASLSGSKGFQQFISYVTANGPKLMSILGDIFKIAGKLISGLAPLGAVLVGLLAPLAHFLGMLSPTELMAIALGIATALAVATGGISAIITAVVLLVAIVVRNWSKIKAVTGTVMLAVGHFIQRVWHDITSWVSGAVRAVVSFVRSHWKLLVSIIGGPIAAIVVLVVTHWNRIKAFIAAAVARVRAILGWFGSLPGRFGAWFAGAFHAVVNWLGRALAFVRSLPGRILHALGNLGRLLWNAGVSIVQGLINGIKSMAGSVINSLLGLLPGPLKHFAHALGIGSPSKVFAGFGSNIGEGLVLGIRGQRRQVHAAVLDLAAAARAHQALSGVASLAPQPVATAGGGDTHLHFDGLTRGAIEAHVRAGLQAAQLAERRRLRPGRAA